MVASANWSALAIDMCCGSYKYCDLSSKQIEELEIPNTVLSEIQKLLKQVGGFGGVEKIL